MINTLKDIWTVFSIEVRRVFSDRMVLLIFFLAPILYPFIFCFLYHTERGSSYCFQNGRRRFF